jgi:GNAT superfamily N-acetyltransferase
VIAHRRATPDDIDALLATVQAGFDSYVSFAPAGWRPPNVETWRAATLERLSQATNWALLALDEGRAVGHVAFHPARVRLPGDPPSLAETRPLIQGLAHLGQLFVLPDWWGRGVAPALHDAAVEEMRVQGYERARLFTPTDHLRAKRFYERRGWTVAGAEDSAHLGLSLTEYLLDLRRVG